MISCNPNNNKSHKRTQTKFLSSYYHGTLLDMEYKY